MRRWLAALTGLLVLTSAPAHSAITYFGQAASHADNAGSDESVARDITPPALMVAGDLAVVCTHLNGGSGTITNVADGGQTWTAYTAQVTSHRGRCFSAVFNGTWSANPSFSNSALAATAFTAHMLVFRPTTGSYTWSLDVALANNSYAAPSNPFDVTITGQTPTASASVVTIAFWSSSDDNTWVLQTAGGWAQPGGVAMLRNSTGIDQSNSWAYLIQSSAAATGNVVNRQTANGGDQGATVIITFKETAPSSALTGAPTVTAQDDNDYTLSGSTTGAVTVYAVACIKDSTAPTIAQVAAAHCTGDVAAQAAANESWNGSNNFVLGGALTLPIYDLYSTDGTTLYTLADESLDAPAGKQNVTLTSVGTGAWVEDFNAVSATDAAASDIVQIDLATDPTGYPWHQAVDGNGCYPWNGVSCSGGDSSRQLVIGRIYDASAGGWIAGYPINLWFNDPEPTCEVIGDAIALPYKIGNTLSLIDLATVCTHSLGDTLTFAKTSGTLPSGVTIQSNGATGEDGLSLEDEDGAEVEATATDIAGGTATLTLIFYPLDTLPVPNCTSSPTTAAACAAAATANWLSVAATFECSPTVEAGNVISQNPAGGTEGEPDVPGATDPTTVDLVVSAGACRSGRRAPGLGLGIGIN